MSAASTARAEAVLRDAMANTHHKLADMLRVCADALPRHPDPRGLCRNNARRLNASLQAKKPKLGPGMHAVHVVVAAEAFSNAAATLEPINA